MTATTSLGLPYLEPLDPPDIAGGLQALAEAVDAILTAVAVRAKGVIAQTNVGISGDYVTETIAASVTFTAEANRMYRVTVVTPVIDNQGTGAQTGIVTLRHATGGSVTAAGTLVGKAVSNAPGSTGSSTAGSAAETVTLVGWINNPAAGQLTVGVGLAPTGATAVRFLSGGTSGPDYIPQLVVEDAGAAI
jgi:hypothetical protein